MTESMVVRSYDVDGDILTSSEFIDSHSQFRDRWRTACLVLMALGLVNVVGLCAFFGHQVPRALIVTNVALFAFAAFAAATWWVARRDVLKARLLWHPITPHQRAELASLVSALLTRGDNLHAHVLESAIRNWEVKGWLTRETFVLLRDQGRRRLAHLDEEEQVEIQG